MDINLKNIWEFTPDGVMGGKSKGSIQLNTEGFDYISLEEMSIQMRRISIFRSKIDKKDLKIFQR